jgi:uncharacterized protein with HEPN domain
MSDRTYVHFLQDILKMTSLINSFTNNITYEEFIRNDEKAFATVKALEIIAEAIKEIPEKIRLNYPEIDWRGLIGMRNITIHQYWSIDYETIWEVICSEIPQIDSTVSIILKNETEK